jgi:UDP-N-acetylmuramyl pentapeptide phosphotransferase/UDP-N-acetylglucosamine-1-phosphate transferase
MIVLFATVLAFIATLMMVHYICKPGTRLHLLDHPNERSLHVHAVPRTGGIAILTGIAVAALFYSMTSRISAPVIWVTAAVLLLAYISFLDDRKGLSVPARLVGQISSAVLVVSGGMTLTGVGLPGVHWIWPQALGIAITVIYLVWMVNLYNFMDGMDGFAGGMAVLGFGSFALLGYQSGDMAFMSINMIISSSAAAFLLANFPPARLFMGDAGSATLGLLVGSMSIWAERQQLFPFWVSILVFSPFIVDSTLTLLRRLLKRERIWQAHKTHYYQRLVQLGWGHRRTVLSEYVLMVACGVSALAVRKLDVHLQWILILGWISTYAALSISVNRLEQKAIIKTRS